MSANPDKPVILMVGHGSPRPQVNEGFKALANRIAARIDSRVLPTFFSLAQPDIERQVALLAGEGVRRILLMPYFLYYGQHVSKDIPALLDQCRKKFPEVTIEVLSSLEGEPALEDIVADRLMPYVAARRPLPTEGRAIEQRSVEIIESQIGQSLPENPVERAVVIRVTHATADFSFARSLRFHPRAVSEGLAALAAGKPVICDVKMLQAGVTRHHGPTLCAIGDAEVVRLARERKCTRAAVAMERLSDQFDGAVVAIGNAPTALWKIMEIAKQGGPKPALVVGVPVGFVGALDSKVALMESGLTYIVNLSPRGGSPVAAAVVNALALEAGKERKPKEP
jgi:precorrin-8X/cobalt-precorrin-8 methylmutase